MSKDYANRTNTKTKAKPKGASRGKVGKKRPPIQNNSNPTTSQWLMVLAIVALFIGGLSFLKRHQAAQEKTLAQQTIKKTFITKHISKQPEFDFYSILPKEKVWEPKASVDPSETTTESTAPTSYILQVAAFQQSAVADQYKAKLQMEGYAAQVDSQPTNGWYRVWIGPLKNLADAQDMQMKTAQTDNAKGIILQVPVG